MNNLNTTITITTVDDMQKAANDFAKKHIANADTIRDENAAEIARLSGITSKSSWELAASAYALALQFLDQSNEVAYKNFLMGFNTKNGRLPNGKNKWLSFCKSVFGSYQTVDGVLVWVPDRSREKYANYLRHFYQNGIKPEDVVAYIENFDEGEGRRHLVGIERRDRADNPSAAAVDRTTKLREAGRNAAPLSSIDGNSVGVNTANIKQGALWFTTGQNGKLEIRGFYELSDDRMDSLFYNAGKALQPAK